MPSRVLRAKISGKFALTNCAEDGPLACALPRTKNLGQHTTNRGIGSRLGVAVAVSARPSARLAAQGPGVCRHSPRLGEGCNVISRVIVDTGSVGCRVIFGPSVDACLTIF